MTAFRKVVAYKPSDAVWVHSAWDP